jgi:Zn-dependent metalloprotease/DNA-binding beta-propeller fold protein YncE
MTRLTILLSFLLFSVSLSAQQEFKPAPNPGATPANIDVNKLNFKLNRQHVAPSNNSLHQRPRLDINKIQPITLPGLAGIRTRTDKDNHQVYALEGRPHSLPAARADKADAYAYLTAIAAELGLNDPENEIRITEEITDELGQKHLRLQQVYQGLTVLPADARLHARTDEGFDFYTGRLQPSPKDLSIVPAINENAARTQVQSKFEEQWINLPAHQLDWISGPQLEIELVVYAGGQTPTLAWYANVRPNLKEHTSLFLDAQTGAVLHESTHTCGLDEGFASQASDINSAPEACLKHTSTAVLPDGPATANVVNLYDQVVTINTFSLQDQYLLIDGTRPMFTNTNGEIDGLILSYDGQGGSPQRNDFDPNLRPSTNNSDWTKTEASVQANAGIAYQYFFDKFGRNSIDGNGGNVLSLMNINETDGTQMDNAFWNGRALFYGNGADAFSRLPRGLDVAGHEMAHGVIQATADLIYEEQPGALNESFADIFGYLIEGETGDYRLGEDVVTNAFPSGALRDMRNPNNGASSLGQRGWQPKHMNEFANLPNTEDGDRGGVHINSGITNRAFFLFSSNASVGDSRAEQVYYRALSTYLTRSSRFADLRIAVVSAAGDLYGGAVVAAAQAAFDGVGIGGDSEAGDYTVDLEANGGDRFLLLANTDETALFLADEVGALLNNPLETVGLGSRPSLTDDGEIAVFVDDQGRLRTYNFNTSSLGFIEGEPGTNWRNIAISKDGNRIAVTTTDQDNRILIFDFVSERGSFLDLTNPTTSAGGVSTGDVLYADALEWEPGGDFLMYDALSRLDANLEFWDIGFLRAWNTDQGDFGDGNIRKLASSLPEGVSIGNPTFSKNSPYIIAFEEVDFENESYKIIGANTETGESATIFENSIVNYPNYGLDDDRMVFDAQTTDGTRVLAVIPIAEDKISAGGNASAVVTGGHWGYFFANGDRDLNTSFESPVVEDASLRVFPTATSDLVTVEVGDHPLSGAVQVLDLNGRKVTEMVSGGSRRFELSLGHLAAGNYILALPTEAGTVIRKLVVAR